MSNRLIPLPQLPNFISQPYIVKAFDMVRENDSFDLYDENGNEITGTLLEEMQEKYAEFYFFARDFPRFYRYEIYKAEYHLNQIYIKHQAFFDYAERNFKTLVRRPSGESTAENLSGLVRDMPNIRTEELYFEFEAFLNAVNSALEILAKILNSAYRRPMPYTFNKLCEKRITENQSGSISPIDPIILNARNRWIKKMKEYRDCFTHITPVDYLYFTPISYYYKIKDDEITDIDVEVRCKIPINPEIRQNERFRFKRNANILKYSIYTYKNLKALDNKLGKEIIKLFNNEEFPQRRKGLYNLGSNAKT